MDTAPNGQGSSDEDWCREFIEHNCILRCSERRLISRVGGLNTWQIYMQNATLNQKFQQRIGRMFWGRYRKQYDGCPFQIAALETGGIPLAAALQATAYRDGVSVNVFSVKKESKSYGLLNWYEGIVLQGLPVMIVDEVAASGETIRRKAELLRRDGLDVCSEAFAIASCRRDNWRLKDAPVKLFTFYGADDFTFSVHAYRNKYRPEESDTVASPDKEIDSAAG